MTNTLKFLAATGLAGTLAVIGINAIAVLLPLNGMSTGAISALYPNLFVPAGFTFSIWSVIYILLLMFAGYQCYLAFGNREAGNPEKLLRYYLFTCLLNISWIFAWHYLQIQLSVAVMLAFLFTLAKMHQLVQVGRGNMGAAQKIFIRTPVSVYFGWISVATIANITAWLVSAGWDGWGIAPQVWSSIMIGTAILLGIFSLIKWKDIAYTAVISWALYGIYFRHQDQDLVANTASIGLFLLAAGIVFTGWRLQKVKVSDK